VNRYSFQWGLAAQLHYPWEGNGAKPIRYVFDVPYLNRVGLRQKCQGRQNGKEFSRVFEEKIF
jgi:hypothetical protein